MVIRCGGTMNTIANMSLNTPAYSYAYKYAAFDGLRRLVSADRGAARKGKMVSLAQSLGNYRNSERAEYTLRYGERQQAKHNPAGDG